MTLEPHLHVELDGYDAGAAEPRAWSVPGEIAGVWSALTPLGPAAFRALSDPGTGTWVSREPF